MQNEAKFFKKSNIKFWSMLYYFIVLRFPWLIYYILINKLQNTSKKRRQHQTKEIVNLKYTVQYYCLAYKLQCLTRISSLKKMLKFWNFLFVWYRQSAAVTLLTFCASQSVWQMNGKASTIVNSRSFVEFSCQEKPMLII